MARETVANDAVPADLVAREPGVRGNADIRPGNRLWVAGKLNTMDQSLYEATDGMSDCMAHGFAVFQHLTEPDRGFSCVVAPSLVHPSVVPLRYNADRLGHDLSACARLNGIEARCLDLPALEAARPEAQPVSV